MLKSKYQWNLLTKELIPDSKIFKTILKNRNIEDYETFLSAGKESLHSPLLLKDMDKAVTRIHKAISADELIMIYGDYDCDGISSIALLYRALKVKGANVIYDLPDRFIDGYGLNNRAVQEIIKMKVKLVITVDNGISCSEQVDMLCEAGIDTIITDHHEISEDVPKAYCIIHAKLSPDYPFKEIAGVMVAYKLACALHESTMDELMDLAMIGTIADLMPLTDENQAMVNLGLQQLKKTKNLGLQKLIEYTNIDIINTTAIAFKLAPKINSSGRLGKALDAVRLLVTEDHKEANALILKIDRNHKLRKKLTEEAFETCEKLINPMDNIIVVASQDLHEGVIGICAQKIVEKYQRSTLVITVDDTGIGKGSMRSFGDDNILDMLHDSSDLLLKYGGHSQAAGLQIKFENIGQLRRRLNQLGESLQEPIIDIDMELDLCDVKISTIQLVQDRSFYTASYLFKNLQVIKKHILARKHTKLVLSCHGVLYDALDFNSLEYFYSLEEGDVINLCAGLNVNNYRNTHSLQLMIKDISCDGVQVLDMRKTQDYSETCKWVSNRIVEIDDKVLMENSLEHILEKTKFIKTYCIKPKEYRTSYNKIANRTELQKIFAMLRGYQEFTVDMLVKRTDYTFLVLDQAVRIFTELNLIEKTKDGLRVNRSVQKVDLNDSPIFRRLLDKKEQINWLYTEDIIKIKEFFIKKLEEQS